MIRLVAAVCLMAFPAVAQEATTAPGGILRILDKITGVVQDVELQNGEERQVGLLTIRLGECRFPTLNPSGDAYEQITVTYLDQEEPVFDGWIIASAPAISALEHPRYDIWALRCITS